MMGVDPECSPKAGASRNGSRPPDRSASSPRSAASRSSRCSRPPADGARPQCSPPTRCFSASITFPYATALFAHAGTIGLLAIALWASLDRDRRARDYIAGLCAGFAVASEYPAIIPGAVLGLYLLITDRRARVALRPGADAGGRC